MPLHCKSNGAINVHDILLKILAQRAIVVYNLSMNMLNRNKLNQSLTAGAVYRRNELAHLTTAIDRDLANLVDKGSLEKVAPGLYYKPRVSRFGALPPNNDDLVKAFLRGDFFLLYSWNDYNALGLGLTQLYNRMVAYNRKRHGVFTLAHQEYDFRRPARGFPEKLSREFLLVDLVNNLNELDEDPDQVKRNIEKSINTYDLKSVMHNARLYGKIATQRYFEGFCQHNE